MPALRGTGWNKEEEEEVGWGGAAGWGAWRRSRLLPPAGEPDLPGAGSAEGRPGGMGGAGTPALQLHERQCKCSRTAGGALPKGGRRIRSLPGSSTPC